MANRTPELSVEDMIGNINERISLLEQVKVALVFGLTGTMPEDEVEQATPREPRRAPQAKPARRARKHYSERGSGEAAVMEALSRTATPLSLATVTDKVISAGWVTSSRNPKGRVYSILRHLQQTGKVVHVGSDYLLAPQMPLTQQDSTTTNTEV